MNGIISSLGEYHADICKAAGKIASKFLFHGQWVDKAPDWFDHRHHLLDPEKHFTDFWAMSADNVIMVTPMNAKMLDLCAGDCFYAYYFWRHRAKEITCVDINPEPIELAKRLYKHRKLRIIQDDVLKYTPKQEYFDVVVIRGAIEHFSQKNQQLLFKKAHLALKKGGWFCGDTIANTRKGKLLKHHENEWTDEKQMKEELSKVFNHIETFTLISKERTTLFWRCKKN